MMKCREIILAALLASVPVLLVQGRARATESKTWVYLADGSTGRVIAAEPLSDGEEVVYTWKNSMFRLMVTEVLVARVGRLVLTEVTYADPGGLEPPLAGPEDLEDLFQTGGPFRVTGISKPFTRLVFRVGEIGDPKLKIRDKVVALEREVGFGGTVILTLSSSPPSSDRNAPAARS